MNKILATTSLALVFACCAPESAVGDSGKYCERLVTFKSINKLAEVLGGCQPGDTLKLDIGPQAQASLAVARVCDFQRAIYRDDFPDGRISIACVFSGTRTERQ